MRHGRKFNHLGRTSEHRKAMLANMATSLILNKRIETTVAKAKALRKYVEPLITKSKDDSTHSRRIVFSYLKDKTGVTELFREVSPKIATRPGGYTRIIKLGTRLGDGAETCMIELVDYNSVYVKVSKTATAKKTTRRGGKKKETTNEVKTSVQKPVEKKKVETIEDKATIETVNTVEQTENLSENTPEKEESGETK
ncbi:MAG: 50S ribosomal protein L17 [Endomicrobiia bacterium]